MSRWKYSLGNVGLELREAINNREDNLESCRDTMQALNRCYERIKNIIDTETWFFFFEDYFENFITDLDILNEPDEIKREDRFLVSRYTGYNSALDMVNNDLKIFYDLCDRWGIWISLVDE